ncbi:M56 family metallopeptidase [Ruegeria hyattellae]|uniref:M56 family metallopeptidase n=1 Tax=Ruegeria hyattellae TaxID=3233337 RepID=UPI00355BEA16
MMAAKQILEVFVNLNIMLVLGCLIWLGLQALAAKSALRHAFILQLAALKTVLVLILLSPVLAIAATHAVELFSPGRSLVLSDMVVAAYLRGDIAMDAIRFEEVLNARENWTERFLLMNTKGPAIVAVLLAAGMMVAILRLARSALQLHRLLADSYRWKRVGPVDIRLSDRIAVPMATRGVFRRHVLLPSDLISDSDRRRIAIAHELQHFRQSDLEWEIVFELMRPFFFWNPAFTLLKLRFNRLRELACDQAVVSRYRVAPLDYARCLLHFCERSVGLAQAQRLNVALLSAGRKDARQELANRLLSLKSTASQLSAPRRHLIALACVMGTFLSFAGASLEAPKDWSHDRLMLSTVVNLERLRADR